MTKVAVKTTGEWMATAGNRAAVVAFVNDEAGQDLIEYALVAALLSLSAVVSLRSVSSGVAAQWNHLAAAYASAI